MKNIKRLMNCIDKKRRGLDELFMIATKLKLFAIAESREDDAENLQKVIDFIDHANNNLFMANACFLKKEG